MVTPAVQATCFKEAGKKFGISPLLLEALARKESHMYNHAVNHDNKNHTEDVCMMGINSSHFKHLATLGITRQRLLSEPCVCIASGAWVLSGFLRKYGRSWDSVGMYNAGPNPKLAGIRHQYATSVRRIFETIEKERGIHEPPFNSPET